MCAIHRSVSSCVARASTSLQESKDAVPENWITLESLKQWRTREERQDCRISSPTRSGTPLAIRRAKSQDSGVCTGWARTSPRRPDRLWPRATNKNVAVLDCETGDLTGLRISNSPTALPLLARLREYMYPDVPCISFSPLCVICHYRSIPIFLHFTQRFSVLNP
jgi:hypothetical protein